MAWSSLASRIGQMPTVLAGPILRTVTQTSVTMWIALKEFATVTLTIHSSDAPIAATIAPHSAPPAKPGLLH